MEQQASDLQPANATVAAPSVAPAIWEDADAFTDFLTAAFGRGVKAAQEAQAAVGLLLKT